MILILLLAAACFLAFSNGANDNFKGVATIYGSGTADYRTSMAWATVCTFAGSIASVFFAETLLRRFSGKGLVPDLLTVDPGFLLAVALAAGCTVILATRLGFPISTTHGLLGALIGAGSAGIGISHVNLTSLTNSFVVPLVLSPVLAVALGAVLYCVMHALRWASGMQKHWCVCMGVREENFAIPNGGSLFAMRATPPVLSFESCEITRCTEKYSGRVVGFDAQKLVDIGQFISAGIVSFARGLNDTPKMAALLLMIKALTPATDVVLVGIAIAFGGILAGRRVAETMSHKITTMNPGQGLTSNLSTAALVLAASTQGLPVSTTQVAVGSLFGIGLITGQARMRTMTGIVLSWIVTLPCAAAFGFLAYLLVKLPL